MENKCWTKFEYIACICFTGYIERQKKISDELSRVGILGRTNFFWDFPSPFTSVLSKNICRDTYHQKMFPVGYNNYRAIKTAYELGFNSILVIEDDIRFLKDLSLVTNSINILPDDYEIAMLDKNFPPDVRDSFIKENKPVDSFIGVSWRRFSKFHSSGCYTLSKEGMRKFISAYEKGCMNKCLVNNDQYFNNTVFDGRKMYASFPNLAIQSVINNSVHLSPLEEYITMNEYQGGGQEMYNIDNPFITKHNFITNLYRAADRDIQEHSIDLLREESTIYCSLPSEMDNGIRSLCNNVNFRNKTTGIKYDGVIVWGNGAIENNLNALQIANCDNVPIILSEDGFIRSYTTWVAKNESLSNRTSHSFVFDSSAYYFDATRISDIEKKLNDSKLIITEEQKKEAHRLIEKIVSNKISKYNHQPIFTPKIGRDWVKKILVIDQSYGDFSIKKGMADDYTFEKMLQAAINENPEADILVKTHPDTIAGKRAEKKGYYQDLVEHDNIYKVTFPINPYSLMELCDKVYVCSSQFGIEALMAGKEVHVFGMPFYAGWGLTIDDQHLDRRTNKRTLEELFYIFYCMYTHWVDPEKRRETTIDEVIDKMIELRKANKSNHNTKISSSVTSNTKDDFGYKVVSSSKIMKQPTIAPIPKQKSVVILPRIDTTHRPQRGWL